MVFSVVMENETRSVGMGQIVLARKPARLTAVLGSCVGVAMHHPRLQLGVLAHVVLADSNGRASTPGKFADTAVPHMMQMIEKEGGKPSGLVVKLAGGACMFGAGGPLNIGEANIAAVLKALGHYGIRVADEDLGGTSGRRVSLDCESGILTVQMVGCPARQM